MWWLDPGKELLNIVSGKINSRLIPTLNAFKDLQPHPRTIRGEP